MNAVRRLERQQPSARRQGGDGLEAGLRSSLGIVVLERSEAVRSLPVPNDVVGLGAVELEQPQLRFGKMNAVAAVGVAGPLAVRRLLGLPFPVRAAIVQAILAASLAVGVVD